MKLIAASIMALAGAILLVGGAYIQDGSIRVFVMGVGCAVVLTGLGGWFAGIREK
jgi:hypothetical protein